MSPFSGLCAEYSKRKETSWQGTGKHRSAVSDAVNVSCKLFLRDYMYIIIY
jgi:hypothetical protein